MKASKLGDIIAKTVFGAVIISALSFVGAMLAGKSERADAEKFLAAKGFKIESYEGQAGVIERERFYASDKFNVTSCNGQKQEVIVGRKIFYSKRQILIN